MLNVSGKCLNITSLNAWHKSLIIVEEMIHNFALNHMALCTFRSTPPPSPPSSRSSNRTRHKVSHYRPSKCLLLNVNKQISFCDYQTPYFATYECDNEIGKFEMQLRKPWPEDKLKHRILARKFSHSSPNLLELVGSGNEAHFLLNHNS